MKKFKVFLSRIKTWIGYLLVFMGLLFAGGFFLVIGICIGVFSAVWSVLERLWYLLRSRKAGRTKLSAGDIGSYRSTAGTSARGFGKFQSTAGALETRISKCRTAARTMGKVLVMAGVMGMVKAAKKLKGD